jgi:hypothetical protein
MAKSTKKADIFMRRRLNAQRVDDVTLLEAIEHPDGENRKIQLFFTAGTLPDKFRAGKGLEIIDMRSIGEAPILNCSANGSNGAVAINMADIALKINPGPPKRICLQD